MEDARSLSSEREISFIATIPPYRSGILAGGDGMQLKLDIPATEVENAAGLLALKDTLLRVTITVEQKEANGRAKAPRRRAGRKRDGASDSGV